MSKLSSLKKFDECIKISSVIIVEGGNNCARIYASYFV